ncbi:MAG: DNA repair protein RecO [Verrucomicrobiia bacterium]
MSDEKDEGFVIKKYPFSETSLIIHWLTKNSGLISTIARGVFRQNSKFYGRIDLFYCANIEFKKSQKSDLYSLKEVDLIDACFWIRENISALHKASYAAILIEKIIPKNTPIPHIFALFSTFLNYLKNHSDSFAPVLWLETKLLIESGEFQIPEKHRSGKMIDTINILIKSDSPESIVNLDLKELNQIAKVNLNSLALNEQQQNLRRKALGDLFS